LSPKRRASAFVWGGMGQKIKKYKIQRDLHAATTSVSESFFGRQNYALSSSGCPKKEDARQPVTAEERSDGRICGRGGVLLKSVRGV